LGGHDQAEWSISIQTTLIKGDGGKKKKKKEIGSTQRVRGVVCLKRGDDAVQQKRHLPLGYPEMKRKGASKENQKKNWRSANYGGSEST